MAGNMHLELLEAPGFPDSLAGRPRRRTILQRAITQKKRV